MTVTVTVQTTGGIDLSWATLYDEMANSPIEAGGTATQFTATDTGAFNGNTHGGIKFIVTGTGLTYSGSFPNIQLTGGTITGVQELDASNNVLTNFTGFNISAVTFNSAVNTFVTGNSDSSALDAIFKALDYDATGNSGIDKIEGGNLGDTLRGGGGNDTLIGGGGNDFFVGGGGNDAIDGGAGNDTASYTNATTAGITASLSTTSSVTGNASVGTDTLVGVELIRGSNFADTFTATTNFVGNNGSPFNEFEGMGGDDTITGNGDTRLGYTQALAGVAVDLSAGTAHSIAGNDAAGTGVDSFTGVNAVRGSNFDDTITAAGASSNFQFQFIGLLGNDTLTGSSATSDLARYDLISNGAINNGIIATLDVTSTVTDKAGGNAVGTDTLIGIEQVRGTSQADNFTATTAFVAGNGSHFNDFEGMGGNDIIVGNGNTRVDYSQALSGVTVNLLAGTAQSIAGGDAAGIGVDSFAGTIGPDNINRVNAVRGSAFDDTLSAAGARGSLDFVGGGGNDTLIGSAEAINNFDDNEARYDIGTSTPNAISVVLGATSTVTDIGGSAFGTDTLINIERVRGTDLNDTFVANAGFSGPYGTQNSFEGMGGNDTITGNGHTFIRYGNADAAVTVNLQTGVAQSTAPGDAAGIGVDTITGGVNEVLGSNFNDTISGSNGAGAESFNGGQGNDTIDGGGGLLDRVAYRNLNATTGVTVNLTTGSATDSFGGTDTLTNIEGVLGSEFNDLITGDGNTNRLQGQNGDDQLFGMAGNDFLVGDDGVDLYANAFGSGGTPFDSGNDLLDGGAGADQMWGGKGNDTYIVDNAGDVVTENANEGIDTVKTSLATYTLAANVENLTGTVNTGQVLTGNVLANTLSGLGGTDTLNGMDGADTLNGMGDADTLIGGSGADKFLFDNVAYTDATASTPLVDVISDYDRGNSSAFSAAEGDQIDLSALLSTALASGQAVDKLVRVVENGDGDGALVQVDVDGTGTAAHWTTIAKLDGIHLGNTVNVILSSSQPAGTTLTLQGNYGLTGDFDGDGKSDILWRNDNGSDAIWFMNGGQITSAPLIQGAGSDWHVASTGDFNADGKDDILWRNDNGSDAIWFMNGGQITSAPLIQGAGSDWHVAGTGDFNADGKDDILWRNDNGADAIWFMDGGQVTSTSLVQGAGSDWHIVSTGDFNGDGKADIFWRNDNGADAVWLMNGGQVTSTSLVQGAGSDWHIVGSGDFNGDGTNDLLWRNDNGSDAIWLMNGGQVTSTSLVQGAGSDWHVVGTGDFNGDGKADIQWRNDSGANAMWLMDGTQISSAAGVQGAGLDWHVAVHHYDFV